MVKLSVIYGPPTDPAAFETYYTETHMPLAAKVQGLRRFELSKVVGTPDGSKPAVYRMADLYFDSPDHMKQVMATPEARATAADLKNFATGGVKLLISEVQEA
jgi:uncharacterized protein (TIGR02118 family)